ncbi:MAG: hypothetical protein KDL87_16945, partial [Verrucomicrobiae bacterium]|nr:hypothetical protein [Verrucomicrobiae bacterium]
MRFTTKLALKAACVVVAAPFIASAQQTVVTADGTEILVDALTPDMQAQVFETQQNLQMGRGQGPLKVNTEGQFYL